MTNPKGTSKFKRPQYVAAIIQDSADQYLIALTTESEAPSRLWQFPRGRVEEKESAEAAMRRVAFQQLGIQVEIQIGQPPIPATVNGSEAELRYFFCGIITGTPTAGHYPEIRWVSKAHLLEYEFDEPSRPVAEWLVQER